MRRRNRRKGDNRDLQRRRIALALAVVVAVVLFYAVTSVPPAPKAQQVNGYTIITTVTNVASNGASNGASTITSVTGSATGSITHAGTTLTSHVTIVSSSVYGSARILLSSGATVAASSVKPGMVIESYDPATGATVPSVVTGVYERTATDKYVFNNALQTDGSETMFIDGRWMLASQVKVGDSYFDPQTGLTSKITSINITNFTTPQTVYDFLGSPMDSYVADGFVLNLDGTSITGVTELALANGGQAPVYGITPGTVILSYDSVLKETVPSVVTAVLPFNSTNEYVINNGALVVDAGETLYVNGKIEAADQIKVGDDLFDPISGQSVPVTSIIVLHGNFQLYDVISSPIDNRIAGGILTT